MGNGFVGINHVALVTNDMEKTVRFYRDVLGLPLVATTGNDPEGYPFRHYFFAAGPGSTIAFFEWPAADAFRKEPGAPTRGRIQFDHLCIGVESEEALLALRDRLEQARVPVSEVADHGFIRSITFHDPNGIALEVAVWTRNLEQSPVFEDAHPVPSAADTAPTTEGLGQEANR